MSIEAAARTLNAKFQWFNAGSEELPQALGEVISDLDQDHLGRLELIRRHTRLYGSIHDYSGLQWATDQLANSPKLSWNIIQAVVDTAQAHIGSKKSRPKFITKGGTYKDKQLAEDLTYFIEGIFRNTDFYGKSRKVHKDALITGTGYMKITPCYSKGYVECQRVQPEDVYFEFPDTKDGDPSVLYVFTLWRRSDLAELYPDKADSIYESSGFFRQSHKQPTSGDQSINSLTDYVEVLEVWKKESRYCKLTTSCVLEDKPWPCDFLPVLAYSWNDRPQGLEGQGISEQLTGLQVEVNLVLRKIQKLMSLASSKVFVQKGSSVNQAQLNNEDWGIVEYQGEPPIWQTIQAVSPEYVQILENLYAKAFELTGISQLASTSKKPSGLNSGTALREYEDIQTKRFMVAAQDWEDFTIEAAELFVEGVRLLEESQETNDPDSDSDADTVGRESFKVIANKDGVLQDINWSDIQIDRDSYKIQAWPVPAVTGSPAYQLQTSIELMQINPALATEIVDRIENPDVRSLVGQVTAPRRLAKKIAFKLSQGKEITPEPVFATPETLEVLNQELISAMLDEQPEEILDNFREFIEQLLELMGPSPQEQAQQQQLMLMQQQLEQAAQAAEAPEPGKDNQLTTPQMNQQTTSPPMPTA